MGKPSRYDFFKVVAKREGVPVAFVIETISAVIACPKRLTHAAASEWLAKAFPADVAAKAAEIIERVYQ
jgi:hypothetical protein